MRVLTLAALLCSAAASLAPAQSLASRIASADGTVQVLYPSRPSACGDGENYVQNVFGTSASYSGDVSRGSWASRPCVHGPARIAVTVIDGEVARLRTFVGPVPPSARSDRTITVSAPDAAAWLAQVIDRVSARIASDAMLPLVLADGSEPWQLLLRIARDEDRALAIRRSSLTWLAMGVSDHLGLADERNDTADDELRKQAVFALSQHPKSESVPELIDIVRTSRNPAVRRSAIFWLGQTGDPRAADVYAELLR